MNEQATRFPLAWPVGWRRTAPRHRRRADFGRTSAVTLADGTRQRSSKKPLSVADAISRVSAELARLGVAKELLSTNVETRLDGLPRSNQPEPSDPGAAVYCEFKSKPLCFACDKWDRVADNIAAIAQHIDALRRIDRYGVGKLEQAFAGYAALPQSTQDWWQVLGLTPYATLEQAEEAFKKLARDAHPDVGGSHEAMSRLSAARDLARQVLAP